MRLTGHNDEFGTIFVTDVLVFVLSSGVFQDQTTRLDNMQAVPGTKNIYLAFHRNLPTHYFFVDVSRAASKVPYQAVYIIARFYH